MPAGTDTRVRTPGISRPHNTTAEPWRLNQRRLLASQPASDPLLIYPAADAIPKPGPQHGAHQSASHRGEQLQPARMH